MEESLSPLFNSDPNYGDTEADDSNGSDGDTRKARVGARTVVVGGGRPLKKGPWTPEEDNLLATYVKANGVGNWNQVQKNAGLNRCGKSCRLRWANHLRPELKKGPFDKYEVNKVIELHAKMGNRWAKMTVYLPGRTDNEIKNFWNTRCKRLQKTGQDIYPSDVLTQAPNKDMDCHSPDDSRSKKRGNEVLQGNGREVAEIVFNNLDYGKQSEFFFVPRIFCPNSPPSDVMNPLKKRRASSGNIASEYNISLPREQFQADPERTGYPTDFSYGITQNHSVVPFGSAIASGPPISDGNFSSSGAIQRPPNMELPSFQYPPSIDCNSYYYNCSSASPILQDDTYTCPPVSTSLTQEGHTQQQIDGMLDFVIEQDHGLGVCTKPQGLIEDLVPFVSHAHPLSPSPPGTGESSPSCADTPFASTCHTDIRFPNNHIPPCHATSFEANCLNEDSTHSNDQSSNYFCLNEDSTHSNDQSSNDLSSRAILGDDQEEPMVLHPSLDHLLTCDWASMPWASMPGACDMPDYPDE